MSRRVNNFVVYWDMRRHIASGAWVTISRIDSFHEYDFTPASYQRFLRAVSGLRSKWWEYTKMDRDK